MISIKTQYYGLRCKIRLLLKRRKYRRELEVLRAVIACNMQRVLGGKLNVNAIAGLAGRNLKYHETAAGFLEHWKYKTRSQHVEWDGYEILENARKKFGSLIVCSIHFGNYYLFPFEVARSGIETILVVGDQHKQLTIIEDMVSSLSLPVRVIKSDQASLLKVIRELKRGRVAYLLIDEIGGSVNNEKLLRVRFLGQSLRFKKGIGALCSYSGLPVVPVVAEIKGNNESIIHVRRPVEPSASCEDRRSFIDNMVMELFKAFEADILKDPAQWQKWVDLKRYMATNTGKVNVGTDIDLSTASLKISREHIRLLRDRKGYILIDMRNGRYFSVNEIGCYAARLMYKLDRFDLIESQLRRKFPLSKSLAENYIRKIASVGLDGGGMS